MNRSTLHLALISENSFYFGIFFHSGRNKYIYKPPQGSIITDIFRIIAVAVKRKRSLKNAPESIRCGGLLDYARVRYGGPYLDGQVDTVLSLARIVPILATLIIYWVIYFQVGDSTIHTGNSWFSINSKISWPNQHFSISKRVAMARWSSL